jgi:hypothetical protein
VANLSKSSKDSFESMSSHLHLKDSCFHIISNILPQGPKQLETVAQEKSEMGSKEGNSEKRQNVSHNKYDF